MCRCQRTRQDHPPRTLIAASGSGKSDKQFKVVGVTGVEPVTLRLSSACSNQLSYTPERYSLVELRRFELLTYSLQSYRSTN